MIHTLIPGGRSSSTRPLSGVKVGFKEGHKGQGDEDHVSGSHGQGRSGSALGTLSPDPGHGEMNCFKQSGFRKQKCMFLVQLYNTYLCILSFAKFSFEPSNWAFAPR